jgi:hypothetical protein
MSRRDEAVKHDHLSSADRISPYTLTTEDQSEKEADLEVREVFRKDTDGVAFRTVSWQRAAVVFLKIQFAMSILSVPGALATLGAIGGAVSIVGWGALNTCKWSQSCARLSTISVDTLVSDTAVVLGDFHNRHPECHSTLLLMTSLRVPQTRAFSLPRSNRRCATLRDNIYRSYAIE